MRPGDCQCGESRVEKYTGRVSGPLLDRFDLRVRIERPAIDDLMSSRRGESTAEVAQRVATARTLAIGRQGVLNAHLPAKHLDDVAKLHPAAFAVLRNEMETGRLSGRGYHRVRRVARTIEDLTAVPSSEIDEASVALALELRASTRTPRMTGHVA